MLRKISVGSVALNTRAEAVLTNASSIQLTRRSPVPIKTIMNTGSVVSRVWAKVSSNSIEVFSNDSGSVIQSDLIQEAMTQNRPAC